MMKTINYCKKLFVFPKKFTISFFLVAIFTASSWALFFPKFFRVHDFTHAARISQMTLAITEGHFPVRWTKDFGFGYGMPLFEFYAPLPYYTGSLFYWLGLDMVLVLKLLFAISSLMTLWGGYKLGEKLFGSSGGLVVAAAITLAPYRAVDLFIRGALSEAWAIMALPWVLYGLMGMIEGKIGSNGEAKNKKNWLILIFSLTTLFLSHNLTTIMFVPMSILFGLVYWWYLVLQKNSYYFSKKKIIWKNVIQTLLKSASGYLMAGGLSAFYLGPAFLEKNFTKVEEFVLGGYFDYSLHFLYIRQFFNPEWGFGGSGWGVNDEISFFLGYGQWFALAVAGILMVKYFLKWVLIVFDKKKTTKNLLQPKFILSLGISVLLGVSLFMSILKSKFVWDLIPLLSFIQFPWRWLSVAAIFVGLVGGTMTLFLKGEATRFFYAWLVVAVIVGGNFYYFRPENFLENSTDYYYTEGERISENMSSILQDYIPTQMSDKLEPVSTLIVGEEKVIERLPHPDQEHIRKIEYDILLDKTHEKLIQTNYKTDQVLELNLADFPGWFVELDGLKIPHLQGEIGNIEVNVPAGTHLVGVKFGYTTVRLVSDLISLGALVILIGLTIDCKKNNKSWNNDF